MDFFLKGNSKFRQVCEGSFCLLQLPPKVQKIIHGFEWQCGWLCVSLCGPARPLVSAETPPLPQDSWERVQHSATVLNGKLQMVVAPIRPDVSAATVVVGGIGAGFYVETGKKCA